jgi:hypothetical protein
LRNDLPVPPGPNEQILATATARRTSICSSDRLGATTEDPPLFYW